MKKTLVMLFAMVGVAMGAGESITLPDSDGFSWIKGSDIFYRVSANEHAPADNSPTQTNINDIVIENLAAYITKENLSFTGWYGGLGGGTGNNGDITIRDKGFTFNSRSGMNGTYVAIGISKAIQASSITLKFTASNNVVCSLWNYDANTKEATMLDMEKAVANGSLSYDDDIVTSQLFVVWGSRPEEDALDGAQDITVSDISLTYTAMAATPSIPEPTTATLSLLALAGLAARRRRK